MRYIFAVLLGLLLAVPAQASEFMGVTIAPEEQSETYNRDDWEQWSDADGDKVDTRHEVLIVESLVPVTMDGHRVKSGLWVGPYTGFVSSNPHDFQIDHMVPLKEAHVSGGHGWTPAKKEDFANDLSNPQHLIAVKGGSNGSKSFRDPAEWMPPNRAYWCRYLGDWLEIKRRWNLTMDQDEAKAVKQGLKVCERYLSGDRLDGRH